MQAGTLLFFRPAQSAAALPQMAHRGKLLCINRVRGTPAAKGGQHMDTQFEKYERALEAFFSEHARPEMSDRELEDLMDKFMDA
jgi:hypothetical protein